VSFFPITWAISHAPTTDAIERVILIVFADRADADGRNARLADQSLAGLAHVPLETLDQKCADLERRGLIRRQDDDGNWEVMVPAGFWSAVQLKDLNEWRNDSAGLPPITPQNRPAFETPPEPGGKLP
jgi:squalene cyclase